MGQLNKATAGINEVINVERHYLSGYETTGLTTTSGNTSYLTAQIDLEENTYYIIHGGIMLQVANTSDAILKADVSGISSSFFQPASDTDFDTLSSLPLPQVGTATPEGHVISGTFATGSTPSVRFKITPTSGDVDVYHFYVEIMKVTDVS